MYLALIIFGSVVTYAAIGGWFFSLIEEAHESDDHPYVGNNEFLYSVAIFWPIIGIPVLLVTKRTIRRRRRAREEEEKDRLLRNEGIVKP